MLTTLRCPSCAAALPMPSAAAVVKCGFCGATARYDPDPPAAAPADSIAAVEDQSTWSIPRVLGVSTGPAATLAYVDRYRLRGLGLGAKTMVNCELVEDDLDTPARIGELIVAQLEDHTLVAWSWPTLRERAHAALPAALSFRPLVDGDTLLCATADHKVRRLSLPGLATVEERAAQGPALRALGFRKSEIMPRVVSVGGRTFDTDDGDDFPDLGPLLPEGVAAAGELLLVHAIDPAADALHILALTAGGAVKWSVEVGTGNAHSFYVVDGVAMLHSFSEWGTAVGVDVSSGRVVLRTEGEDGDARITLYDAAGAEALISRL